MDGSAPVLGYQRVYEGSGESRSSTTARDGNLSRVAHEGESDRIRKGADKKLPRGRRVSHLIQVFDKQTTIYDPGANPHPFPAQTMALIGGGGDYGGTAEDPTHPKPSTRATTVLDNAERRLAIMEATIGTENNWDGEASGEKNAGPEARLSGMADLGDEFCMEEEEEEEELPAKPKLCRMVARYYSLKTANYNLIHKHFSEVWRIRGKMSFKPLKNNFFIITFALEGDYKFVEQGGPWTWIHLGVACLIAPLNDKAQPSDVVLDTVRLWVRFYDVPWRKQMKEYGERLGSNFGKVVEVDVDAEGLELSEYLRVRIDWPLNQRPLARFKSSVKGQPNPRIYQMRYERVPYYCFHCGFIIHNEEQCENRMLGTQSLQYDLTLCCSPKRKFQSRTISTLDEPAVRKNLRFNTPEGSVSSSSLGIPSVNGRASRSNSVAPVLEVPVAVDVFDGFEEGEHRTEDAVETALANTVNSMSLKLNQEKNAMKNEAAGRRTSDVMPGAPMFVQGSGSGKVEMTLTPEAMKFMKETSAHGSGSQGNQSGPHSSDMIPPLRGLSQLDVS
ncbi:hypothetical protein ACQ4PT_019381 [Festuca glaucescens]